MQRFMSQMNISCPTRTDCRKQSLLGLGEGLLSSVLAGVIIWYYFEHGNLPDIVGKVMLVFAAAIVLTFPTFNFLRRDYRLVAANVVGLLLPVVLGLAYMVVVWVMLAYAYSSGRLAT